jgi:hypothetical protein
MEDAMPVRWTNRGVRGAGCLAALTLLVASCSLGGEGDSNGEAAEDQAEAAETGPDVEALRAAWAEAADAACADAEAQIETLAQGLPAAVEQDGLAAAAEQLAAAETALQEGLAGSEPAPGDEAQVEEMAALYEQAGELRMQAVGSKYAKGDRRYYALMAQSEEARAEADAIATELGADGCAAEAQGPYATLDGLAAVRWADRASQLCLARDQAFASFRPTDTARFDAATRRWLRQVRALRPPEEYAAMIKGFLNKYAASIAAENQADAAFASGDVASGDQLLAKSNRLVSESTTAMYDVGFAVGFQSFCQEDPR